MTQEKGGRSWRHQDGRITYFNSAEQHRQPPIVVDIPASATLVHRALVTKREARGSHREATMEAPHETYGAVYDENGEVLPEFAERQQWLADKLSRPADPPEVDEGRLSAARRVEGTCVYLGDLTPHYGHFLLESLSRAWFLKYADNHATLIYHPAAAATSTDLVKTVFATCGISQDRILLATEDLLVDQLIVPSCQYFVSWKASPGMCLAFDHIRDQVLREDAVASAHGPRIYLSRSRLGGGANAKNGARPNMTQRLADRLTRKQIVNEEEVETVFRELGFAILYPETMPFADQVRAVARADVIAGMTGSALHSVLFNNNPDTRVISVDTRMSSNQVVIEKIRGLEGIHILCGSRAGQDDARTGVDTKLLKRALDEIGEPKAQHAVRATSSADVTARPPRVTAPVATEPKPVRPKAADTKTVRAETVRRRPAVEKPAEAEPAEVPPVEESSRSAQRLNEIASVIGAKRYLEIGVCRGRTFTAVDLPYKVAVDTAFKFDWQGRQSAQEVYFEGSSDKWFLERSDGSSFDLIFIDGLHTFEQCLRDFSNSLSVAHPRTVWVIDDTVPTDPFSVWPHQGQAAKYRRDYRTHMGLDTSRGMGVWHGDVFKLIFMIHDFYPALSYRTVRDPNGQTILWWEPRTAFTPIFNNLEKISQLTFFDFLNRPEALHYSTDEEVQTLLSRRHALRDNASSIA